MADQSKPVFGATQPALGTGSLVTSVRMGRPPKVTQLSGIHKVLADNIRARMLGAFPAAHNETDRIAALAQKAGIGHETVRRILLGESSPRIDIAESIATALGVSLAALLMQPAEESNRSLLQRLRS